MSTTIYNGYKLTKPVGFGVARELQTYFGAIHHQHLLRAIVERAVFTYDQDQKTDAFERAYSRILIENMDAAASNLRADSFYDFTLEIVFLSDPESPDDSYAMYYGHQQVYRDAWEELPWVGPYPYWNNSDEPEGVSRDEWEERKALWDRLLPGYFPPSASGVTWRLDTMQPSLETMKKTDPETVTLMFPERGVRARNLANMNLPPMSVDVGAVAMMDEAKKWIVEHEDKYEQKLPEVNLETLGYIGG